MPVPRIEDLRPQPPRRGAGARWWSEWCFVRVCWRQFRRRLAIMLVVLLGGALLFLGLEPERNHSFMKATYLAFLLIWGESPEEFPTALPLQVLFFVIPVLGITIIIEGIIDFSLTLRDRRRFERNWCTMLAKSYRNHIVVVGLGRLGYRTFLTLRRLGEPVVVIERDPNNQFLEDVRRDGSPIFIGDARREALLGDANIAEARSLVIATDDDLANLEVALDARKMNPAVRVVMRLFDQNMADKVRDGFNIHLAMSQSALSAPTFASCALAPSTLSSAIIGGELVATQRWLVTRHGPLCGLTVADVQRRHRIGIVQHHRAPAAAELYPDPELRLEPGDGLLLQGPVRTLESLRTELEERVGAAALVAQ